VHGRTETTRSRRSSSSYALRCERESRPHCAPSPSARHLRLPCGNADSRQAHACERGRVTYCGSAVRYWFRSILYFFYCFSFITALDNTFAMKYEDVLISCDVLYNSVLRCPFSI
jgi:hypothetical protein